MQITKLRSRILAATFVALVALGTASAANAYSVYRSVNANPGTGVVDWTLASFGVSGTPPTLSFFHNPNDDAARTATPAAQCFVKVYLGELIGPLVGTQVPVGNAGIPTPVSPNPLDHPRPFPWNITFDSIQPGHWSIARAQIVDDTTNAAASRVAAAGFRILATRAGSGVTVINGTLGNCTAQ
ncbi:hypothetical protein G6L94_20125 [Agrobacterium rhizogenes]|uniref:Uncharacterized protein n=2 Tax=Rhizobium rhizogenes TaxID=359 RepID=B9JMW1_RHIR8|nr:hypothetical protein [Rhizobium rhizogenes]ACM28892.1 hypothetical protein Arad_7373 [Rhizobium rhizogenes K84]KAA6486186.1 hypothetical protein DXT98_17530 [Agrobacterium sp. ICMP 7243]OCI93459.1 hypothetical protein A6U85_19845 [Agrobacterium sp. 13-626]OCJ18854.1 hypothetical protein A6U88_13320 [Agrobacterium sp. B131/95]OCJ20636.1 hypothetical protein A6U89_12565 [Agrobacterium sp. B133/95]